MRGILSVLFPLIALLGWCGTLQWTTQSGHEVRLAIEGYDPRDLLSGHYLTFRFSFASQVACSGDTSINDARCVCLAPLAARPQQYERISDGACDDIRKSCATVIKGVCQGSRFVTGLERYYIPEELAPVLSTVPQGASAAVSLSTVGQGVVTGVYVESERIEEYARRLLLSSKQ